MSTTRDDEPPASPTDKRKPQGDYTVGYRKPPVAHRFKPGHSANPKGRRKGSRNREFEIRELLFEPVTVREGGETRQMSVVEAVFKKIACKALTRDNKSAITILGLAQNVGILTPEQEQVVDELSESDLAIMEDVKRRLEAPALEVPPEPPGQPDKA